jgi:hypothetical protein
LLNRSVAKGLEAADTAEVRQQAQFRRRSNLRGVNELSYHGKAAEQPGHAGTQASFLKELLDEIDIQVCTRQAN